MAKLSVNLKRVIKAINPSAQIGARTTAGLVGEVAKALESAPASSNSSPTSGGGFIVHVSNGIADATSGEIVEAALAGPVVLLLETVEDGISCLDCSPLVLITRGENRLDFTFIASESTVTLVSSGESEYPAIIGSDPDSSGQV